MAQGSNDDAVLSEDDQRLVLAAAAVVGFPFYHEEFAARMVDATLTLKLLTSAHSPVGKALAKMDRVEKVFTGILWKATDDKKSCRGVFQFFPSRRFDQENREWFWQSETPVRSERYDGDDAVKAMCARVSNGTSGLIGHKVRIHVGYEQFTDAENTRKKMRVVLYIEDLGLASKKEFEDIAAAIESGGVRSAPGRKPDEHRAELDEIAEAISAGRFPKNRLKAA